MFAASLPHFFDFFSEAVELVNITRPDNNRQICLYQNYTELTLQLQSCLVRY